MPAVRSARPGGGVVMRALAAVVVTALILAFVVAALVLGLRYFVTSPAANTCTADAGGDNRATLDDDQAATSALIGGIALQRELPARAVTVALATAMQESKIRNITYGDRDSVGIFQQRPSQGWGTVEQILDPVYSTNAFYDGLEDVAGWQDMDITVAAQEVQRSAFPDAYAQHETMARAFAAAFVGQVEAGLVCSLDMPDPEVTGQAVADSVTIFAQRDLDREATEESNGAADETMVVSVDSAGMVAGENQPTSAWAVAHWAVATASETDAVAVAAEGMIWLRSDGDDASWAPLATAASESAQGQAVIDAALEATAAGTAEGRVFIG